MRMPKRAYYDLGHGGFQQVKKRCPIAPAPADCVTIRAGMDPDLRIAIDIRPALLRGTGVGTFVEQLVSALDSLDGGHRLLLFTSSWSDRWPRGRLEGLQRSQLFDRRWPVRLLNLLWHRLGWPPVERFVGPADVLHSPTPLLLPGRGAKVVTLHDLHFLRHPEHTRGEVRRDYAGLLRRHLAGADAVVAVSEATAREAEELLGLAPERVVVCGEDAAPLFDRPPSEGELRDSESLAPQPFFLFVGTIEPRKNLPDLLRAYAALQTAHPELRLVLAGERGWSLGPFEEALGSLPEPSRVVVTGYRDQVALRALYRRAVALVMPSLCEGFGLPLVEAMACGCPLIVAERSAMPEVAGDAALYWRGDHPEELAALMEMVLADGELHEDLGARSRRRRSAFSWRASAETVLALYRDLAGGGAGGGP